jgi:hypothetical protein
MVKHNKTKKRKRLNYKRTIRTRKIVSLGGRYPSEDQDDDIGIEVNPLKAIRNWWRDRKEQKLINKLYKQQDLRDRRNYNQRLRDEQAARDYDTRRHGEEP